jgi:hypothetical protein
VAAAPPAAQRLATGTRPTVLCGELLEWVVEPQIPGTCAFASSFTKAPVCNHLAQHERASVGALKFNPKVWCRGTELRAAERAAQSPPGDRQQGTRGERTPGYFTKTIGLPEYPHAVRSVSLGNQWHGKEPVKLLIPKQTPWEVTRGWRYGQRQ